MLGGLSCIREITFKRKGWKDFLTSAFVRQRRRETKNPWERMKINIVRTAYSVSVSECRSLSSMPLIESNDNRSQCNVKINLVSQKSQSVLDTEYIYCV